MRRKKIVFLISFILVFFVIISYVNISNASTITKQMVTEMNTQLQGGANPTQGSSIVYLLARIFTAIQFIGTGISIIIITRLGITYMMSSVEEKAQIKQRAVPILMGTFVLVATVNILKFIQVFVTN